MSDEKRTLVEEGTELSGTLRSTCPVTVRGSVEGELAAPSLEITATGRVRGDVRVDALVSKAVYFPMHRFPKEPVRLVY